MPKVTTAPAVPAPATPSQRPAAPALEAETAPFPAALSRAQRKPSADKPTPAPKAPEVSPEIEAEAAEDAPVEAELPLEEVPLDELPPELDMPKDDDTFDETPLPDLAAIEIPALPTPAAAVAREPIASDDVAEATAPQPAPAPRTQQPRPLPADASAQETAPQGESAFAREMNPVVGSEDSALPAPAGAPTSSTSAPAAVTDPAPKSIALPAPTPTPPVPEARFAESNHPSLIDTIRTQLLPDGGRMQIRLDPPELGSLQIEVQVRDGVLTASFQTSTDQATQLLGQTLTHLKQSLESHGLSIDRLHVQQAAANDKPATGDEEAGSQQQRQAYEQDRQDQQRRELLQRMWKRLADGRDPLDLLA